MTSLASPSLLGMTGWNFSQTLQILTFSHRRGDQILIPMGSYLEKILLGSKTFIPALNLTLWFSRTVSLPQKRFQVTAICPLLFQP